MSTLVALVVIACGCETNPKMRWDNARQIKTGMTTAEVTQLIGKPYSVAALDDNVQQRVWVSVNQFDFSTKSLRVDFRDGKVVKPPAVPDEFKD